MFKEEEEAKWNLKLANWVKTEPVSKEECPKEENTSF